MDTKCHLQNCLDRVKTKLVARNEPNRGKVYPTRPSLCMSGEKVRTMKITTSKTKKNIEKVGDDHYKSDQNVEKGKDQNIESVHLFSIKVIRTSKFKKIRTSKVTYLWCFAFLT